MIQVQLVKGEGGGEGSVNEIGIHKQKTKKYKFNFIRSIKREKGNNANY